MPTPSPFTSLLDGLQGFRARVEGTQGNFRLALLASGQPVRVREVSGATLRVVCKLLVWLRDGIVAVQQDLVAIDALLAIGEVVVTLLQEIGDAVAAVPSEIGATAGVTSSLSVLGEAIDALPEHALMPTPELVAELRTVLEQLVGTDDDASTPGGSVGELLHAIESLAA